MSLQEWGAYFRLRDIEGSERRDAIMLAPRLPFLDNAPYGDFAGKARELGLVSLTFVTDPLYMPEIPTLEASFDTVKPFKTHYIHDYRLTPDYSDNHLRNIRYAQKRCAVRDVALARHLQEWLALWEDLTRRHQITGWGAFSSGHFTALAEVAGIVCHGAYDSGGSCVAMSLWAETDYSAVAHLSVCSAEGYRLKANYAVYAYALEHFKNKKFLDFGSNVGLYDDPEDGLSYFKAGFSNIKKSSYLCGMICDETEYARLSASFLPGLFFPAYRTPKAGMNDK